jgi:hypothetical protein
LQAAKELYEFAGAGGNIAWIVRDAQHASQDRDLPDLIAIMDKAFGRSDTGDHRQIELNGFSLSDTLMHGLNLTSGVPSGMAVEFSSPLANRASVDDPIQMYVSGSLITASVFDDGNHGGYIERYGASLKIPGAPPGPWDGTTNFQLSVKNIKLQALPGFTFAVDIPLTKTQVPAFAAAPTDGFSSPLGEAPSWNSQDLQNTPYSGNFHGSWPLYPDYAGDTGARPVSVPTQTAFGATITVTDASATGLTLRFSEPLNPDQFGVGLDAVRARTTQWAPDGTSAQVTYGRPVHPATDVTIIVFRAVDTAGNMIGGPVRLVAEGNKHAG